MTDVAETGVETGAKTGAKTVENRPKLSGDQRRALVDYLLHLGDSSLILGHRLGEWCGHGPVLEEDIAITNISLDLIGQARMLLTYAGELEGEGRDEDALAFTRDVTDFRNLLICEQPNGDFAMTVARQFLFSAWQYEVFRRLQDSADGRLAAIAAKSLKEVSYHRRHSGEWLIRLGDGTEESHTRAQAAIDDLWIFVEELFTPGAAEKTLAGTGVALDPCELRADWAAMTDRVLDEATLAKPDGGYPRIGGREGDHSEYLGYILAELQFMQRAYPDMTW